MARRRLGLENAALGLRPREAFSRPRSQFFSIRTSQQANTIYIDNQRRAYIAPSWLQSSHIQQTRIIVLLKTPQNCREEGLLGVVYLSLIPKIPAAVIAYPKYYQVCYPQNYFSLEFDNRWQF